MKESTFLKDVVAAIKTMPYAANLRLREEKYSPDTFGNAYVHFVGDEFEVRFVRDRGDVFFEVENVAAGRWWPVDMICEVLQHQTPGLDLTSNLHVFSELLPSLPTHFGSASYSEMDARLETLVHMRREAALRKNL